MTAKKEQSGLIARSRPNGRSSPKPACMRKAGSWTTSTPCRGTLMQHPPDFLSLDNLLRGRREFRSRGEKLEGGEALAADLGSGATTEIYGYPPFSSNRDRLFIDSIRVLGLPGHSILGRLGRKDWSVIDHPMQRQSRLQAFPSPLTSGRRLIRQPISSIQLRWISFVQNTAGSG